MTSAAEHRRPVPSDGDAILNALPNPVLLVAPDATTRLELPLSVVVPSDVRKLFESGTIW